MAGNICDKKLSGRLSVPLAVMYAHQAFLVELTATEAVTIPFTAVLSITSWTQYRLQLNT